MKVKRKLLIRFVLPLSILVLSTDAQELTNKLIWDTKSFKEEPRPEILELTGGRTFAQLMNKRKGQGQVIIVREYETGMITDTLFISDQLPDRLSIDKVSINKNERFILIATNEQPVFRRSSTFKYFLYNTGTSDLITLFGGENVFAASFSPDNRHIAYVRDNDIYLYDYIDKSNKAVTDDGLSNKLINGIADWVYEEEFAFHKAFEWSPDGKYLAFYQFDVSVVPEIKLDIRNDTLFKRPVRIRYPRAGERNPDVSLYVYKMDAESLKMIPISADNESYIPRIQWTAHPDKIAVLRMNRLQNELNIHEYDANSDSLRIIYKDRHDKYLEVPDKIIFLSNRNQFIITNNWSRYNHITLIDMEGDKNDQFTVGKWDVSKLYGVDEINKKIYFQASIKNTRDKLVYSVDMKTSTIKELGPADGYSDARFNSTCSHFILEHSSFTTPPYHSIYDADGNKVITLIDNISIWQNLEGIGLQKPEFFEFNTVDTLKLYGWMIKPPDFDASKKYPVIQFMYGGPGSQTVVNRWQGQRGIWHQMMSRKGFIVASVDNRGTGSRGEEFTKIVYGQLGGLECHDQIETAKYLAGLHYTDPERISAWGWSYGGYLSSLLITRGGEYFESAVAVAPVTSWRFYDTIYTERYLGLPDTNPRGYDDNSPICHAEKLNGRYLLIHGTADDNVHFTNSTEMINELENSGKQYEFLVIDDDSHSLSKNSLKVFESISEFLSHSLKD